ncbi:MAG: class I SAM-dependent methyltransferase [Alphaproteobacteria bacterium]
MTGEREAYFRANRANWNERVAIHRRDTTGGYRIDRFLAGDDRLNTIEDAELGDVAGKRLLHLQCHFGMDTLRLARRGATVTGIDFSPDAIAAARELAARIGRPDATFVEANVYDAPAAVGGQYDVVFTTWGAICWLPDIPAWARVVARMLRPGGLFYFADGHPGMLMLEQIDGRLLPTYPQDTPPDAPLVFDEATTYAGDGSKLTQQRTYQWIHSISRIVNALLEAGLAVEHIGEYPTLPWAMFPMFVRMDDEMWRLPDGHPSFPLALTIRARRPA